MHGVGVGDVCVYDVESLCRGFPKRVQLLVEGKGKKLRT